MDRIRPMETPWEAFIAEALDQDHHVPVVVGFGQVPHPKHAGFRRSLGHWHGQRADYRAGVGDGRGLHVHVFTDHYEIHWDKVHPHHNPIGHWLLDSPKTFAGSVAVGALLGLVLRR